MTNRVMIDVLGLKDVPPEAIVACACGRTACVVSLKTFQKMSRARAYWLADCICDRCRKNTTEKPPP